MQTSQFDLPYIVIHTHTDECIIEWWFCLISFIMKFRDKKKRPLESQKSKEKTAMHLAKGKKLVCKGNILTI